MVIGNDLFRDGQIYPRETELYLDTLARVQGELARRSDTVVELVCGLAGDLEGGRAVNLLRGIGMAFVLYSRVPMPHMNWESDSRKLVLYTFPW